MITIPFLPSSDSPFQSSITLDGQGYIFYVKWNLFGQRYYVELYDNFGTMIFNLPLIESPVDYDISMTKGYFNSTFIYRESTKNFEVSS